ncbi:MAG: Uncharacterised protein [Cellulomonadaceae bacterium TMED98]|nr:MAG: Uncharacterised protein [Cellulomonadaceae bacterium TMED98]
MFGESRAIVGHRRNPCLFQALGDQGNLRGPAHRHRHIGKRHPRFQVPGKKQPRNIVCFRTGGARPKTQSRHGPVLATSRCLPLGASPGGADPPGNTGHHLAKRRTVAEHCIQHHRAHPQCLRYPGGTFGVSAAEALARHIGLGSDRHVDASLVKRLDQCCGRRGEIVGVVE